MSQPLTTKECLEYLDQYKPKIYTLTIIGKTSKGKQIERRYAFNTKLERLYFTEKFNELFDDKGEITFMSSEVPLNPNPKKELENL